MPFNGNMDGVTYSFAPRTSGATTDPVGSLTNARNEAYGLARKAAGAQNPQDAAILAMLQQRASADGGPYDAATKAAMMTQASDTAGQIALNSKARIHGSAGDPSVMAANNEADARRLQAIQQAQTGINAQANIANYDARGQAIGQYGNFNQTVQNRQTDNQRYLIDMLTHENRDAPNLGGGGGGGIPSYAQHVGGSTINSGTEADWSKVPGSWSYQPPTTLLGGKQNPVDYGATAAKPKTVAPDAWNPMSWADNRPGVIKFTNTATNTPIPLR